MSSPPRSFPDPPEDVDGLFSLYYDQLKPLYNRLQADGHMCLELLFELVAAWDHLSRHWKYERAEKECVERAASHIKRATFDAYKLFLIDVTDDYDKLRNVDTSIIDNGDFDKEMHALMAQIRWDATKARSAEGAGAPLGQWGTAFEKWMSVYAKCERFREEFFLNKHVEWAKHKQRK